MSTVTDKQALLNLATTKQKEIIRHEFSKDELADMHSGVAQNCIKLSDLEEELQEVKDGFKEKLNPLRKANKYLLKDIRNGFRDEEKEVYLVPDYANNIMEMYNEEGEKVGERRMMMSERQLQLIK
jgi:hypothetical protein